MLDPMIGMHRRDAEEDFGTTIKVVRPDSGDVTWDGTKYVAATVTVYEGGCRLRSQESNAVVVQAGDLPITLRTYNISVPHTASVRIDDKVAVTASDDPLAVGLALRIIDVPKTEIVSVRHLVAVEES